MCGLAGVLDLERATPAEELGATARAMADRLVHRGPDEGDIWVDAGVGLAFGHRRLSVVDLSSAGHQPMVSASGRYVAAYNGEIYNFRALARELAAHGHEFRGHSDTEVMLAAISEWGMPRALDRLNGMFAFALWDREERRLHLVRDRLGEKPLYYGFAGRVLVFASELKALFGHPGFVPEIDRDALTLYLRHNYVPAPYTIYRGVSKLKPGCVLTVGGSDGSNAVQLPYWSARTTVEEGLREPFRGTAAQACDQLEDLLRDAVSMRMEADVSLGAFLSGGIDSSTVVALMQAQADRPVRTFTIGFHEDAFDEAANARAVARHLDTDHTELYLTHSDAMGVIPSLPTIYDEPFADASQIPTFLVSRLARQSVTVSLSGDGGDELFAGYPRYQLGRFWRVAQIAPGVLGRAISWRSPGEWDRTWTRVGRVLPRSLRRRRVGEHLHKLATVLGGDSDSVHLDVVSLWADPHEIVLGAIEPTTVLTNPQAWPAVDELTERMMYLDTVTYLPDDILTKVDRASMAVSLEARVPLLDHRVVELAWRLPLEMKLRRGHGKWILRQLLERYVPRSLFERPKMGFGIPLHDWLRGPLKGWAEELLDEHRLRAEGFLEPGPIAAKWREHLSGRRNWQDQLWGVLMFEAWLERQPVYA